MASRVASLFTTATGKARDRGLRWNGRCPERTADELPKMLEQLGINAEGLGRAQPLLLRDMEWVCPLCNQKGQCDRDLADGTAAENYHGYCANASTLESLNRADVAPR